MRETEWFPASEAPENVLVRVCGDSGYTMFPWFETSAILRTTYGIHAVGWMDVTGDRLTNNGWIPLFWNALDRYPTEEPEG